MMRYADAAALAEDHVAAIQRQIHLYTHAPADVAWHPVARHQVDIARNMIARSVASSQFFGHGDATQARALAATTEDEIRTLAELPRDLIVGLQFTAQDAGVIKLWSRYKIAYSIDLDLWAELGDADDDTVIPRGVLAKLPHPDPWISLPEPILIPTFDRGDDSLYQRIEGFFVTGRFGIDGGGYLPTSTVRESGALSLLICSRIVRADGSHARNPGGMPDYSWTRIGVDEGRTVGEMVEATRRTFTLAAATLDWEREVEQSLRRCVAILLYLCTTNADLQTMPTPPRKPVKAKGKRPGRTPVRVVKVGWRLGAQLRAHYAREAAHRDAAPTGRKVRPHVRRAHFHTFRVGPGRTNERTQVEIKWISAVPINFDADATETTVIGVPGQKARTP